MRGIHFDRILDRTKRGYTNIAYFALTTAVF
jgi:hypothetical protein